MHHHALLLRQGSKLVEQLRNFLILAGLRSEDSLRFQSEIFQHLPPGRIATHDIHMGAVDAPQYE